MNYIMLFARIFSDAQYAEEFIKLGKFRLNTLRFFKDYVDEFDNNIGDQDEGLIFKYIKGQDVAVRIKYGDINESLDFESFYAHSDYVLNNKIFCLYAPSVDKNQELPLKDLHEIVSLKEETDNLGSHLVLITNPNKFVELFRAEIKRLGYGMTANQIDYKDFSQPINIDQSMIGFVKSSKFAHQKEYRFMVDDGKNENSPLDITIGSLEDIAILIPIEDFNDNFQVVPREETE
ncbi:hypothetical protein ABIC56_002782 [Acinetobacter bereziniae]|uniref:hypothetical protein n=1 Tax=Acinetobacter bereziniae TaxID=106648 RepID=UPI002863D061|nr:hypothetical protein [Acinetobacter bereziniae]MDR6541604.1 hypothetical protein [Acinetobacter bereziniae]